MRSLRKPMVDHRMRPAAREHVVAEIDQRVGAAFPDIVQRRWRGRPACWNRRRERLAEQQRRLVTERAAAIETADVALARGETAADRTARRRGAERPVASPVASATAASAASSSVLAGVRSGTGDRLRIGAEEIHDHRFAGLARRGEHARRRPRARGVSRSARSTRVAGSPASARSPAAR